LAENYGLIIAKSISAVKTFRSTYFDQGILNEEWIETLCKLGIGVGKPDTEIPARAKSISAITQNLMLSWLLQ
jgi:hypothetical protein